jgi:hypothetical protein
VGGFSENGGRNRLGCFLASLWLLIAFPLFFLLVMSGGGCEGAPQPCTSRFWADYAFIPGVVTLGVGTAWVTRKLRSGERDTLWWLAFGLAAVLFSLALFLGWKIASIFWS